MNHASFVLTNEEERVERERNQSLLDIPPLPSFFSYDSYTLFNPTHPLNSHIQSDEVSASITTAGANVVFFPSLLSPPSLPLPKPPH